MFPPVKINEIIIYLEMYMYIDYHMLSSFLLMYMYLFISIFILKFHFFLANIYVKNSYFWDSSATGSKNSSLMVTANLDLLFDNM